MREWYIRLIDLSAFEDPEDFVSLMWNIKNRDSFAVSFSESVIRDLTNISPDNYSRHVTPTGKTCAYVNDLAIATCSDTRSPILVAKVVGINPNLPLEEMGKYSVDIHGAMRSGILTEIDYFTIDIDDSDKGSKLSTCKVVPIKEWCKATEGSWAV
jgi:hypothetical protein